MSIERASCINWANPAAKRSRGHRLDINKPCGRRLRQQNRVAAVTLVSRLISADARPPASQSPAGNPQTSLKIAAGFFPRLALPLGLIYRHRARIRLKKITTSINGFVLFTPVKGFAHPLRVAELVRKCVYFARRKFADCMAVWQPDVDPRLRNLNLRPRNLASPPRNININNSLA